MIVIVCGGRAYHDVEAAWLTLDSLYRVAGDDLTIRHGCAAGADALADAWATARGVHVERYPADWTTGRGAGPRRNQAMVAALPRPSLVIAFPALAGSALLGRGTEDTVRRATSAGIRVLRGPCDVEAVLAITAPG